MQQRCRHREPLLIAPGEEAARLAHERFELELLQRPGNTLTPSSAAQPIGACKAIEILGYRQVAIERKLLGDITALRAGRPARSRCILTHQSAVALAERGATGQHSGSGALARPR